MLCKVDTVEMIDADQSTTVDLIPYPRTYACLRGYLCTR